MADQERRRPPLSDSHRKLGLALRAARQQLGRTTRQIPGYTSGHVSNVENGYVTPSDHVIEAYARLGADPRALRGLLVAARDESARLKHRRLRAPDLGVASKVSEDSPLEEIRAQYDFEELEFLVRYDGQGVMTECVVLATARALAPHVEVVLFGAVYNSDPRPGVVAIEALTGCRIVRRHKNDSGAISAVALLDQPASESETAKYSYRITVSSEVRAQPLLREFSPKLRVRQAYRVQFTPPLVPRELWWFRVDDLVDSVSEPTASDRLIDVPTTGFISHEFTGVAQEMIGLAWKW